MPAIPREEQDIFQGARRLPPSERGAFLDEACGDDIVLRGRVAALLRVHDEDIRFLASPALGPRDGPAASPAPTGEGPGSLIGPYRLVELLGTGGMGAVYLAEQTEPVQRDVALKIIKPGMDSSRVIARFEAERQALALMDHPHIAKVFDAGATPSGRLYFVMEVVRGQPITQYCDEHHLTPRQRLELFIPVCHAVQHAHQKGIIHRDLKPSNVLVTVYDGQAVPKIIDFGLAKAVGPRLTEQTLDTSIGTLIGTLQYMSPEQAGPDQNDVDTRSDIYSLGVMLYELLTGSTPLPPQRVRGAAWLELLRILREEELPRPSTRLDSTEEMPRIAANRGVEPKQLRSLVRGDLDWVVMKSLEKDRSRRYATANGLARDLQLYLQDEPVEAGPPGAAYRLRKFARRHRVALATAVAFLMLLAAAASISIWLALWAMAAEQLARAQAEQAVAQKRCAEEEAAIAQAVSDFLCRDLLGQADLSNQPQGGERDRNITVRELLDRAAGVIGSRFVDHELTEAAIRATLGQSYRALGEDAAAQPHLERALAVLRARRGPRHVDTLESMSNLAGVLWARGWPTQAERMYLEALEGFTAALGGDHPKTLAVLHNVAMLESLDGRFEQAAAKYQRVADAYRTAFGPEDPRTLRALLNLAGLQAHRGRHKESEALFSEVARTCRDRLGVDHPMTLLALSNLGQAFLQTRQYDAAETQLRKVLETRRAKLGPDHPDTLATMHDLAFVYLDTKRLDEAEALFRQALAASRVKPGLEHPLTHRLLNGLAVLLVKRGQFDEAEPLFRQVLQARQNSLGPDHPTTLISLNNLGAFYQARGRIELAEPLFRAASEGGRKRLGAGHPETRRWTNNLADSYSSLGKLREAEVILREVAEVDRNQHGSTSVEYGYSLGRLALNLLDQHKYAEAEAVARETLAIKEALQPDDWSTFHVRSLLGGALLGQERYADAEPFLVHGYEGMCQRQAKIPTRLKHCHVAGWKRLLQLYEAWGKPEELERWRQQAPPAAARP